MLKSRTTAEVADWELAFFGEGTGNQAASRLATMRRDRAWDSNYGESARRMRSHERMAKPCPEATLINATSPIGFMPR